jgi:DNA-damage-inducible protein J
MSTIQIRIDPKMKKAAQKTFDKMGLDMSSAIKIYLARVIEDQCVPFQLHVPNKETVRALEEAERGGGKRFDSIEDMLKDTFGKNYKKYMRGHEIRPANI